MLRRTIAGTGHQSGLTPRYDRRAALGRNNTAALLLCTVSTAQPFTCAATSISLAASTVSHSAARFQPTESFLGQVPSGCILLGGILFFFHFAGRRLHLLHSTSTIGRSRNAIHVVRDGIPIFHSRLHRRQSFTAHKPRASNLRPAALLVTGARRHWASEI